MSAEKHRRPSPLQRRMPIVLAALDAKRPGAVATRDIERVLAKGEDAPVYGPNLCASCQRAKEVRVLPLLPVRQDSEADDRPVTLDGTLYLACRGPPYR